MTNQCPHGQLARVCLTCEQAAEIERLTATVAGLRESANLRVRYHAAELADVTAERDEAREEVARLRVARVQFSGADAAEIERLRADNTRLQNEVVMPLRERVRVLENALQDASRWAMKGSEVERIVRAALGDAK